MTITRSHGDYINKLTKPTRGKPPRLTTMTPIMYDEPYVPHVPVGLPHCRVVTRPRGNKREYTHTHTQTVTNQSSSETPCHAMRAPWRSLPPDSMVFLHLKNGVVLSNPRCRGISKRDSSNEVDSSFSEAPPMTGDNESNWVMYHKRLSLAARSRHYRSSVYAKYGGAKTPHAGDRPN